MVGSAPVPEERVRRRVRQQPYGADLWPYMPVCNALQSYYEFSGDPRILRCLTRFFRSNLITPEPCASPRQLGRRPQGR